MSENAIASTSARAQRIRDLERAADEQRERLRAQVAALADTIRPWETARAMAGGVARGLSLAGGLWGRNRFGGGMGDVVATLVSGAAASPFAGGRFPWKAVVAASVGAVRLRRWWKARKRKKHDEEPD